VSGPLEQLVEGAAALGAPLDLAGAEQLLALLDLVDDWNARMNLTAIRDRSQQITKHLLDSLSIHAFLRGPRIVDIGTGAGFPGLPLALTNPDARLTLLDATAKKLAFVREAAAALGLMNVEIVHARAESWRPEARFNSVVARAVGPLDLLVRTAGHLAVGGGRLLAMKGRFPAAEIETIPSGWKRAAVHRLEVPGLYEERHLVELCRSHDRLEA
jgi:16S rRNA (guanine527-N7)-methyltransferase